MKGKNTRVRNGNKGIMKDIVISTIFQIFSDIKSSHQRYGDLHLCETAKIQVGLTERTITLSMTTSIQFKRGFPGSRKMVPWLKTLGALPET